MLSARLSQRDGIRGLGCRGPLEARINPDRRFEQSSLLAVDSGVAGSCSGDQWFFTDFAIRLDVAARLPGPLTHEVQVIYKTH